MGIQWAVKYLAMGPGGSHLAEAALVEEEALKAAEEAALKAAEEAALRVEEALCGAVV